MTGSRSIVRPAAPMILGAALALLGPPASPAGAQWVVAPGYGYGAPFGGSGFGYGAPFGGSGFGYGYPPFGFTGYGYGYGIYPNAFSVLNQPDVQAGLAHNALATGRAAPFAGDGFGPYGSFGVGPYGYAGAAYYNPYFANGLTPLAVQSALGEQALSRATRPLRFRIVPSPSQTAPGAGDGVDGTPTDDPVESP